MVIKSFEEIYNDAENELGIKNKAVFIEHIKGYVGLSEKSIAAEGRKVAEVVQKGGRLIGCRTPRTLHRFHRRICNLGSTAAAADHPGRQRPRFRFCGRTTHDCNDMCQLVHRIQFL